MNKDEALEKLLYSLAHEKAQVITPKGQVYETYVVTLRASLLECVIEPIKVRITSACALEGSFTKYRDSDVWAIARREGSWLLTLEKERDFALGFGSEPLDIMMHGFSSADALGEWCA